MLKRTLANSIIEKTINEARNLSLEPVVVAVLDAGGHLIAYQREDGAGIARYDIAFGKAWGSLGMGFGSRELTERAAKNATFVSVLATTTGGRMVPSPGGILILDSTDTVIGAVGISGDAGDKDEACGIAALKALGLKAQIGKRV